MIYKSIIFVFLVSGVTFFAAPFKHYLLSKKLPIIDENSSENCIVFNRTESQNSIRKMESKSEDYFLYRENNHRQANFRLPSLDFSVREKWKTQGKMNLGIHDASKATPIITDKSIYLATDSSWVYEFDLDSGKTRWAFYASQSLNGIHSTPIFFDEHLYFGTYRGSFYKLDTVTGHPIWMKNLGYVIGASPLLVGESLIVSVKSSKDNGYLEKINKNTCASLWKTDLFGEQSHSSPAYDEKSQLLVFGVTNGLFVAVDFDSGKLKWKIDFQKAIKSTPVIYLDHAYITTWSKELIKIRLSDGHIAWRFSLKTSSQASPVYLENSRLVVAADDHGTLYAIDAETGLLKWQKLGTMHGQMSSPVGLITPKEEGIMFACKENYLCVFSSQGVLKSSWRVQSTLSNSLVMSQFNPIEKNIYLPLAYDAGQLSLFELKF